MGACSCNNKKDSASKQRLWVQIAERQGVRMRLAEMGQWRDITVEVVSMSGSSALLRTGMSVSGMKRKEVEGRGG